ncbi:MAG: hypothetical protein KDA65_10025 [Planctomycetaceae bacterium]|nr:hypothetical protein [Planctomycetaceae bacterium]
MSQPNPSIPTLKRRRRWLPALIGLLLLILTVYGWYRWESAQRETRIKQLAATATLENNPWGIQKDMTESEIEKLLETKKPKITQWNLRSTTATLLLHFGTYVDKSHAVCNGHVLEFELSYKYRSQQINGRGKTLQEMKVTYVGKHADSYPAWLQWLQSTLPF